MGVDGGIKDSGSPFASTRWQRPSQIGRISGTQARMARAGLKKTLTDVAGATGCAIKTIHQYENAPDEVSRKNAGVIRSYYESLGVEFVADAYYHIVKIPR